MFVAITSSSQEQDARCPQSVPADISVEGVHLCHGHHDGSDDNEERKDNDGDNYGIFYFPEKDQSSKKKNLMK